MKTPMLRVTCLWLGLFAGWTGDAAADAVFQAGAAAVDITPTKFPVIINGGFLERTADQAFDRLMSRALVLDDGAVRLAIVVVDNLMIEREMLDEAKRLASEATGIPTSRMLISATHTHSAPSVMACLGSRADPEYGATLPGLIARSIALADESRQPARIGWTVTKAYAFNHCRRWIFRPDRIGQDPFGNNNVRAMMHPGHQSPNHVGPSGPADPDLSLLSVQNRAGKPLAVLANLAMHYKGWNAVSADFCGRFGDALAAELKLEPSDPPFIGIMSQGTSGDSMWPDYSRPQNDPGLEGYTQGVARLAAAAYTGIEYRDHVPLAMAERLVSIGRRLPDAERLAASREVAARLQAESRIPRERPEVYALEAIYLHETPVMELKLQAIRIGDLGITAIPNEVYGLTGLKLKAQSPLSSTFNIELANGATGYIPTPEQHALGGYTTWPARTAGLEVQAETRIVATLLELLEEVAGRPRQDRRPPADAYVAAVTASQPQAFWRLDEMVGWQAEDAAGDDHHGQYEPGVAFFLPGRSPSDLEFAEQTPNRAVHFAGGRLTADLAAGKQYTIELWLWNGLPIDAREITGYVCGIGAARDKSVGGDQLCLTGAAEAGVLRVDNGQGASLSGKTPLNFRTWHHVALVRDGQRVRVYLNGHPDPEIDGDLAAAALDQPRWFFGGRHDQRATWEGKLDDIAKYDRVLTAQEIAAHYQASGLIRPKPLPPPKTAAVYETRPHSVNDLARYAAAVAKTSPLGYWTLHESHENKVPVVGGGDGLAGVLETGAASRSPGSDSPNFTGGRLKLRIERLGPDYSVAVWFWNDLPVTARSVTGYFVSRGDDDNQAAAGDHLGIGGTHAAPGRLIVFNGNQRNELLEGRTFLPPRSWNFVVLTRQQDRVRIFLNGDPEPEIDGQLAPTFAPTEPQLFLGGRNDRFAPLAGRLDQLAVYPRALTAAEAASLWEAAALVAPGPPTARRER